MGLVRRWAVRSLAALALAVAVAPTTALADEYCDIDPGVAIHTPAGNTVVVHVNVGGPSDFRGELASATRSYTAEPVSGSAATSVTLTVTVSSASTYAVNGSVWAGANRSGDLYAQASGTAGTPMTMSFQLNVP